jgi:hypothetical protein
MPEKKTIERAKKDEREGKSPSTQAGEFVRETIDHIRKGKHGARSTKQAIAIGLSKARRAGVKLPPPKKGSVSAKTMKNIERDDRAGEHPKKTVSRRRSRAVTKALQREGHSAASRSELSKQAKAAAKKRTPEERRASALKGAKTRMAHQTHAERTAIARKGARTRKAKSQ